MNRKQRIIKALADLHDGELRLLRRLRTDFFAKPCRLRLLEQGFSVATRIAAPLIARASNTAVVSFASCGAASALGTCRIKTQIKIINATSAAASRVVGEKMMPRPPAISAHPAK